MTSAQAAADGAGERDAHARGTGEALGATLAELRGLAGAHARLAVLEAKQAAKQLAIVLGAAIGAAVVLMCAWITFATALVLWIAGVEGGFVGAFFIVCAINVAIAVVLGLLAWRLGTRMPFKATLRQLRRDVGRSDA